MKGHHWDDYEKAYARGPLSFGFRVGVSLLFFVCVHRCCPVGPGVVPGSGAGDAGRV